MDAVVDFINKLGNMGGLIGIGWELDDKKDKGLQSIILGAAIGAVLKALFTALATGLQSLS